MLEQIDLYFLVYCFAGSLAGLVVGSLPGLSVTMGTALLVSITFGWPVNYALATMLGLYVSGVYAGAVSAILINIPGAPSSVATSLDGYPMAKRGEAARALWTATFHSFVGSIVGFLLLAVLSEPLTIIALKFTAMDYFLLGVIGLSLVGGLTSKSLLKGWLAAALGVMLSLVGQDAFTGEARLTFGFLSLQSGIGIIPVLIGLFGFAEILDQVAGGDFKATAAGIGKTKRDVRGQLRFMKLSIKSSVIGAVIGILPGVGGPIASLVAYASAKKTVRRPERPFGEGTPEGLVASEAANNGCVGGALIPMLTLAIPGDAVTAVLLAGFYVHGLRPGPMLFQESPDLFMLILAGGLIASVIMLVLGATIVPSMSRIVLVPKKIMLPVVSVICVIGTYAVNASLFDVWMMLLFGVVGYVMKKRDYPIAPTVLGIVLGGMMDTNLRRAVNLALASDDIALALFARPITMILLLGLAASFLMKARLHRRNIL